MRVGRSYGERDHQRHAALAPWAPHGDVLKHEIHAGLQRLEKKTMKKMGVKYPINLRYG